MMKLLFARLLPGAAAAGIAWSTLNPVQGTLKIFAIAADALSGETQGEEAPPPLDPKVVEEALHPGSQTRSRSVETANGSKKRKSLEAFADQLDGSPKKEDYGWNAGDRAAKPLQLKGQPAPKGPAKEAVK